MTNEMKLRKQTIEVEMYNRELDIRYNFIYSI